MFVFDDGLVATVIVAPLLYGFTPAVAGIVKLKLGFLQSIEDKSTLFDEPKKLLHGPVDAKANCEQHQK